MNIIKASQIVYFLVQIKGRQTKGITKVSEPAASSYAKMQLSHRSGVPTHSALIFVNALYADL